MYSRLYNLHVDIFKNKNNINNLVINFALLPKTIGCSFKFLLKMRAEERVCRAKTQTT
jgi:hypothetical protein